MAKQKKYLCKFCGESDINNFYEGQKGTCKKCKNKQVLLNYHKRTKKKIKAKIDKKNEAKVPILKKCSVCKKFKNNKLIKKNSLICNQCIKHLKQKQEEAEVEAKLKAEEEQNHKEDYRMNLLDIHRLIESQDKEEQKRIFADIFEEHHVFANNIEELINNIEDEEDKEELVGLVWVGLYLKYGEDYNLNKED